MLFRSLGYVRDVVIYIVIDMTEVMVIITIGAMNYVDRVVIDVMISVMIDAAGDLMLFVVSDMTEVMFILMIILLGISVFSIHINIMVQVTYMTFVMIRVLVDLTCNSS